MILSSFALAFSGTILLALAAVLSLACWRWEQWLLVAVLALAGLGNVVALFLEFFL